MCGIVGYVGSDQAYPILIKGLHRLEYRGYDSAGVALVSDLDPGHLHIYKERGKVADLEHSVASKDTSGTIGIAHTRWATHGEPSNVNAHPHVSTGGDIALVHNGTIENYAVLKEALEQNGVEFVSDTDTEILVKLIEWTRDTTGCSTIDAVATALKQVVGAFAIAVVDASRPDLLIAARKSSPLVIGLGKEGKYLASDASPIVEYTDQVVYLEDDEMALLYRDRPLEIFNYDKEAHEVNIQTLQLSVSELEKGGYPHFMLKEIYEQPRTLRDCIRGRVVNGNTQFKISGVTDRAEHFRRASRIIIVGCGTSWHAGLLGKRLIQEMGRIPVEVEYASEFRYANPVINSTDIVIAISQSGETADTLAAVRLAKERGALTYGVCNVVGSSIARATDTGTYIHVGPEIGVASTKAFTGQVTVLTMMALAIGQIRGTLTPAEVKMAAGALSQIPDTVKRTLALNAEIERLSSIYTYVHNFLYLGRGYNYPSALEGALKLKEISYIHAEGYPAAEMKHGPIALIDKEMPTVVVAPADDLHEKVVSNIQQVKARGGSVIAIVTEGDEVIPSLADHTIAIPRVPEFLSPIVAAIPLQLLAYHIAIRKGRDVDMPRNLAKSVTVE